MTHSRNFFGNEWKKKIISMPELISTPSSKSRIMDLNTLMEEAMMYYSAE